MSTALLLAEPQADTRGFLERHLTNDGFKVVDAEARPDLVLLGDTAGLDACRPRHGDVPVIVLGEPESDTVDRVRALERGCDDFLAKPFAYEELLGLISTCEFQLFRLNQAVFSSCWQLLKASSRRLNKRNFAVSRCPR
jgi:DNA-binding response OmpR family regulator